MAPAAFRAEFAAQLDFELDEFQRQALDALDGGGSVVVAAPTGSGKTVVAQYAVARALASGEKAFYTTPLKALSNQKYGELVKRHGVDSVGLLTGDNAINGDAPVVVMTTEVLRNMIYASAPALRGLRYVVLDEVHYLQNAYRGPVWEEVIIHSPPGVDLVCLSATVSNAEELADWIRTVRGDTTAVIEERRPVELHDLYLLGDRGSERLLLMPTLVDGRPNPEALALDSKTLRHPGMRGRPRGRLFTPRRVEVVELLGENDMLPAIYFIFSRAACDDAVAQCVREGKRLTSSEERRQIRAIAEAHVEALSDADLAVLDYAGWTTGLEAGYAAHHAGLVPPFKEAVEACFAAGLVKAVFATETLSLGINMPARSVVIEKLTKFTGERHEFLTPGEYTQLTGRAGRRGIDEVGYALVLWSPFVPFDQVAGLAGARSYTLTSSFRPTYNMAANLVRRYPPDEAHHLLNLSFAQYRADSDVVRLETQLERTLAALAEARTAGTCERGSVEEYRRLLRASEESARQRPSMTAEVTAALERVRPGDVLIVPGGKSGGRIAVLSTSRRRGGDVRVRAVTPDRRIISLGPKDFPAPPQAVAQVGIPTPYAPHNSSFQRQLASALVAARVDGGAPPGRSVLSRQQWRDDVAQAQAAAADNHPVAGCPGVAGHLRALDRADRLARDAERLERRVKSRSESLARQFDRVLRVLEAWGYVDGWTLTDAGERLARVYHESDLLIAECITQGLLDDLDADEVAGMVSAFTFEARGAGEGRAWFPTHRLRRRWIEIDRLAAQLNAAEEEAGLPLTRRPDAGFVGPAHAWSAGEDLAEVIEEEEISGGDFVRNIKQLIDLVRQLGDVAPDPATARAARQAAEQLFRGVVAASSVVGTHEPAPGIHHAAIGPPLGWASAMGTLDTGIYAVEQWSDSEAEILRRYFTNLDGPVFALVNLPEVVKGALFARYSRSAKSLRRLFLDEFVGDLDVSGDHSVDATVGLARAEQLYDRVFFEYGDDSVAQLGGVHLACEQASNLLTKVLERGRLMSYMEKSTRYVAYDTRLSNGRYRYYRAPEVLDSRLGARYVGDMDRLFDAYAELLPVMQSWFTARHPRGDGDSDFAYRQSIRAKAFDALRGMLPAAAMSNLGIYASGQAYEALLIRMQAHPLPEARAYADLILTELRKVIPSWVKRVDVDDRGEAHSRYLADNEAAMHAYVDDLLGDEPAGPAGQPGGDPEVDLVDWDPDAEVKLIAAMLYPYSDLPEHRLQERVGSLSEEDRLEIVRRYVGERANRRHRPGRALERNDYRFDIISDYGAFRDLQRHRLLTIEWQELTPTHGYTMPRSVADAGGGEGYAAAMDRSAALHADLAECFDRAQAAYAVALAYRIRYVMQCNAREAMHLIELRTSPQGHPEYRKVCQQMYRLIADKAGHRVIAAMMEHVDQADYEDEHLERLAGERRAEHRRQHQL